MTQGTARGPSGRLGTLSNELKLLRERLRDGGGFERIEAQHDQGKLTARERIGLLLDQGSRSVEIGMLVAHDRYDGRAPAAGVVTVVGRVVDREVVVMANDATVEDGGWLPETVAKILRAQEIAMRCRIPIVYLVDSEGRRGAIDADVFAGRDGAGRVLHHAAVMRRHLEVPQLAAVMGPSVGSAAYLPALSDVIVMVDGTSFLGLGSPDLVRETTGAAVSAEELGGSDAHTRISGVAHYRAADDPAAIERLRTLLGELPPPAGASYDRVPTPPVRLSYELYDLVPDDHRQPYDMRAVLECVLDGDPLDEFQPDHAPEMICGTGFVEGVPVGVIANARGLFPSQADRPARYGGLLYADGARKAAYFIETMDRRGTPLLFVQDVAGFMAGIEHEHEGIIRAGAELIEATAGARVPKLVLTLNHASGAGYYAMAGQGLDPSFVLSLPTGRLGLERLADGGAGAEGSSEGDSEDRLDARFAAARGHVDELLLPEELRPALGLLLRAALRGPRAPGGTDGGGPGASDVS